MKKILILFILSLSFSIISFAKEMSPTLNYNIRSMALGNSTFISNSGANALFNNPALLGLNEECFFTIIGFSDGVNDEGKDVQKVITEMMQDAIQDRKISIGDPSIDGKTFNDLTDVQKLKYIKYRQEQAAGKSLTRFTHIPLFTFGNRYFGTGIFLSEYISDGQLTGQVAPKVILKGNMKMEIPIGVNFSIGEEENFNVGFSVRYINFIKFNTDVSAFDLMNFNEDNLEMLGITLNNGFSLNVGAAYTFTDINTTIGLGIQDLWSNINRYNISKDIQVSDIISGGANKIETTKFEPNLKFGITTKPFEWLELTGELDNLLNKNLDGIDDTRDNNIYKKIHLGSEISPLKLVLSPEVLENNWIFDLKLRGGINQGYPTYGALVRLLCFDFEYAHFIEESGYTVGMDPNPIDTFNVAIRF